MDIVENEAVCHQVIKFNALALFHSAVVSDDTFSPKEGPFGKPIKCLAFIRRRLNGRTQLWVAQIMEQKVRSDDAA